MTLQLCARTSIETLVDELVVAACRAAPTLSASSCRELLTLIFVARLRQTSSCGRFPDCQPDDPTVAIDGPRPAGWLDPDPDALPAMFAAAALDRMPAMPPDARAATAVDLADRFQTVMAPLLVVNPRCGTSPVCDAPPTFPLGPPGPRRS